MTVTGFPEGISNTVPSTVSTTVRDSLPVASGDANAYNYRNDLVNGSDLSGERARLHRAGSSGRGRLGRRTTWTFRPHRSTNSGTSLADRRTQILIGTAITIVGIAVIVAASNLVAIAGGEAVAGAVGAPETFGVFLVLPIIAGVETLIGAAFIAVGGLLIADGLVRIGGGKSFLKQWLKFWEGDMYFEI